MSYQTTRHEDDGRIEAETTNTEAQQCPECGGSVIPDDARAERVCDGCGLVIDEDRVDHGPDWRAFDAKERDQKSRVGSPRTETLHDRGLSTQIDWKDKDGYGNPLNSSQREKMKRLRTWNKRESSSGSNGRRLKKAFGEIQRVVSAINLGNDIKEMACRLFRRASDEDLLPGRSIEGVASGAVYAACRISEIPRTLEEIVSVSRVEKQRIRSDYRYMVQELSLKVPPPRAESFLPAIVNGVDAGADVQFAAQKIIDAYTDAGKHSGKDPSPIAAAAVYTANELLGKPMDVTQADFADLSGKCKPTIRKRYQEMYEMESVHEAVADIGGDGGNTTTTQPDPVPEPEYNEAEEADDTGTTVDDTSEDSDTGGNESEVVEDVSPDELTIVEGDDGDVLIKVADGMDQCDVMVGVANWLIENRGLIEELEQVPYVPSGCSTVLIARDPEAAAPDQNATWHELSSGLFIDTKEAKSMKKRKLARLVNLCGEELTFDW